MKTRNMIPLCVILKSKFIPLIKNSDCENLSIGELKIFKNTSDLSKRVGLISFEGNFHIIWKYVCNDYYKQVSKVFDGRTC